MASFFKVCFGKSKFFYLLKVCSSRQARKRSFGNCSRTENLKQRAFKEQKLVDDANALGKKLLALDIKIDAKAGGTGKLFGSINNADLSAALKDSGHEIEKKCIKIAGGTVKVLGDQQAEIRLHREVRIQLPFEVTKAAEE